MTLQIKSIQQWRQAAFNGSFRGLRWQGFERAVGVTGNCVVRSADGKRCALGWLVPDAKLLGRGVVGGAASLDMFADVLARSEHADVDFILPLQMAHDGSLGDSNAPADVERRLRALAAKYNLTIPDEAA